MGRILSPIKNKPEADIVYTPRPLAKEIIDHFKPYGSYLDPCSGDGVFYDQVKSDYKYSCELSEGTSFYDFKGKVDWIITNPPWSDMRNFLLKAYSVADNIVYLCTLTHFCTTARLREMKGAGFGFKEFYGVETPSKPWPQSGFKVGAAHLQRNYLGPLLLTGDLV